MVNSLWFLLHRVTPPRVVLKIWAVRFPTAAAEHGWLAFAPCFGVAWFAHGLQFGSTIDREHSRQKTVFCFTKAVVFLPVQITVCR
jgi:hypothetical protein